MARNLLCTTASLSVLLADSPGGQVGFAYTPFGYHSSGGPPAGGLEFNGERPQPPTGHYLLGNGYRAFNPTLMRFNSPDSWSPFGDGGLNAYAYCAGDPVNNIDPDGHLGPWGRLARRYEVIVKLKLGRIDRVARQAYDYVPPAPAASPGPGPSAMPLSPSTRRRQRQRADYAKPERRAAKLEKVRAYEAKLKGKLRSFQADEAKGIYATKISTRNFMLLPREHIELALAKAKALYGFEKHPLVDRPFFTKGGLLDVHHFDLETAVNEGSSLLFAKVRRMNYITTHVSAVRTGE